MAKGPKFMNPADKARKEARKKELKKNKKQRQQVRSAIIESRDPEQVIADLEKLDQSEFSESLDSINLVSDTFHKEKRKRLKETLNKILSYYEKEDPERFEKIKILERNYEKNYQRQLKEFQAIKAAQEVKIEDIFLPPEPNTHSAVDDIADDDPLLSETVFVTPFTEGLKPPGCPPGPPPDLGLIVGALSSSLANPLESIPLRLPPELISLQMTQTTGKNLQINYKNRFKFTDKHENNLANPKNRLPSSSSPVKSSQQSPGISKSAVIESKPVLFKPKVTKLVPSSVRSKLNKT